MPIWILSALGLLKKAATASLSLIRQYPLQCALIAALVAVAWLWRSNSHLHEAVSAEQAAHKATVASYRKAQADAEAKQAANLTRVSQAQKEITDATVTDYRARLAELHARYDRLRAQGNRGASGNADLSPVPGTAARVDEAPDENGLPAADALIASEQALQLSALIDWVEAQSKVETSARGLGGSPFSFRPDAAPQSHLSNHQIARGDNYGPQH